MIQQAIVLGGGSAGFLAALNLKLKLPALDVTVIRSKEIGIIGVGEGTTPAVPTHLHGYLGLDVGRFLRKTQATWKLGIRFLWGPRPFFDYTFGRQLDLHLKALRRPNGFYCNGDFDYVDAPSAFMSHNKVFHRQSNGAPLIRRNFGYHIENENFVGLLERWAQAAGVKLLDDTVAHVETNEQGVAGLQMQSGMTHTADLYVDCSGFRSVLLGGALQEPYVSFKSTLFCDRAVAGAWDRTDEPIKPYTTAETMDAGWCWQIEHPTRIIRGYVYSSDFITDDAAETEFRQKNPKLTTTRVIKFPSGRYQRNWVKNVVAVGNASGFVEPLEATSLAVICDECRNLVETLRECELRPTESQKLNYNIVGARAWDNIRQFLGFHYKFNTRLDTEFWRANREKCDLGAGQEYAQFYRENGPSPAPRFTMLFPRDIFGMEGYLVMMVGMKVPYERFHTPTPAETQSWNRLRAANRQKALLAMTIPEAFRVVRSPQWKWNPTFFRRTAPLQTPAALNLSSNIGGFEA